ncbi:Uncharacterised protein [Bordetella avium]|nr:Uncharacterised protein [Bordetella avium]
MTASHCIYSLSGPRQAQRSRGQGPAPHTPLLTLVTPAYLRLLTLLFSAAIPPRDVLLAQLRKRPVPPPAA